jgi:hypothetical protein
MKELNTFRKFMVEGKGSTVKLSKSDMDKLHKDKEIEVDDHIIQFGEGEEDVSENTTMPDFTIMGQTFNFSDICPSAHKLVQNQAIVHQGFSRTAPTVLMFAILHRDFFALEKAALGPQGIDVDTFKNDVTRLYTKILNVAEQLGVLKQAKKYMDMHMDKIKDAGFKASEPGGSSDRNFGSDEEEYAQDWRDEQDDLFGKLREVRNRLESEVEGYTDLHENDVALESFLGELNKEIEMVEPQSGHIFYKLNKDVTLKLKTGSTSPTYAPGVLLHPVFGKSIIAKEGQYIINFHGQLFYVDMDEKFATKVPKHEDSGNKENLAGALDIVDMAPKFNPGWKSYLNEPL